MKRWRLVPGTLTLYGAVSCLGALGVAVFLPETEGKSLAQVEEYFAGKDNPAFNDESTLWPSALHLSFLSGSPLFPHPNSSIQMKILICEMDIPEQRDIKQNLMSLSNKRPESKSTILRCLQLYYYFFDKTNFTLKNSWYKNVIYITALFLTIDP